MSEYQYYEFQAIDRPLTAKEQDEIRKHSSRVRLNSTQAIFEYHYGDFRGGELVELNPDLVTAAAQASSRQQPVAEPPLEDWLPALSADEQQEFLLKLVRREPHVDLQLIQRFQELAGITQSAPQLNLGQRRLSDLQVIAETIGKKRYQQEQAAARKQRIKQLEALAPKAAQTWKRVAELIELKQAKPYDEATALLIDLRDLAEYQGQLPDFTQRFEQLKSTYQSRPALMTRFRAIKV